MAGKSKAHGLEGALYCIRENLSGDPHVGIRDVSECELAGLKREMVRLSVSPAPSMPATQTPPTPLPAHLLGSSQAHAHLWPLRPAVERASMIVRQVRAAYAGGLAVWHAWHGR